MTIDLRRLSTLLRSITPAEIEDLADSMSSTQYDSKKWLVEMLNASASFYPKNPTVTVLGSWYGSYLVPFLDHISPSEIILNDINPRVLEIARPLHGNKIKQSCFDVNKAPEHVAMYESDILINTSCEHMNDMKNIWTGNPNTFYVFQSCDKGSDPGHVNPCSSTQELVEKSGLTDVKFSGRLDLGHKNRYMVMGFKRG